MCISNTLGHQVSVQWQQGREGATEEGGEGCPYVSNISLNNWSATLNSPGAVLPFQNFTKGQLHANPSSAQ